jgi:hypothetical protein
MKPMIKLLHKFNPLFFALVLTGCTCGEDYIVYTGQSKVYTLQSVSDPNITGIIKFDQRSDNVALVVIYLKGTKKGNSHPAFIHTNTIEENGEVILNLNPVKGATGISETLVSRTNDGNSLNYDQLIKIKGHVKVHLSQSDMETLIAQGNIGE